MKAFFYTTNTVDCFNHVRAWNSFSAEPAYHYTFSLTKLRNDGPAVQKCLEYQPDVIFYIGPVHAPGMPKHDGLRQLRKIAPSIHLCSDATDKPWHKLLKFYKEKECFDLQVAIDGALDAPVDLSVLTPVDISVFSDRPEKDIRCGFSGGFLPLHLPADPRDKRRAIITNVPIALRNRLPQDGYEEHGEFLVRCKMLWNASWTGSGERHHMKGRVVEAGWASCALLEHIDSPIGEWFPDGCWLPWRTVDDLNRIVCGIRDEEITLVATNLHGQVSERYRPEQIYGEMLSKIGLDTPIAQPTA